VQLGTWSSDSPFLQQQQQQQQQPGDGARRSSSDGRPLENGEVGSGKDVLACQLQCGAGLNCC
jgi:hypothetical protein